jgi:hypothetical protein
MLGPDVLAEHVYPFQGHLDAANKNFTFSVKMDGDAALNVKVEQQSDDLYQAVVDVQHLATPFFDMTTEIQSVVDVHRQNDRLTGLSGTFRSRYSLINEKTVPELSGRFNVKGGTLQVDDFVLGDFRAQGSMALMAPHDLDAVITFDKIDLTYVLDWLSGQQKKFVGDGELSGRIALSGTPGRIAVKSTLESDGGYIESLAYDHLALQLAGIYPLVELTNSTVTKTGGFSFDLDGTMDLSDKKNMASQIALIKKIPLVKDTGLQSEWVLKRVEDADGERGMETKYFLKKDKAVGISGADGYANEILGVEKKIGF